MGSTSSKHNAVDSSPSFSSASSSSSSVVRRTRSRGTRVFQSSCLGLASGSHDDDDDDEQVSKRKGNNVNDRSLGQVKSESDQVRDECFSEVKAEQSDEMTCISSSSELDEWDQSNLPDGGVCKADSSSSARSSVPSGRFISRFSFFPSNASFRLNRTASLGSSRGFAVSSTSFTVSNLEDEVVQTGSSSSLVKRNDYSLARHLLPACLNNQSSSPHYGGLASGNLEPNPTISGFSDNLRDDQVTSVPNEPTHIENTRVQLGANLHSPRNQTDLESIELRNIDRRINAREPAEGNVHFSRTLSVGRLRDRVLRRSLTPDSTFPSLQQERELVVPPQHEGVHDLGGQTEPLPSNYNASISITPSINNSSVMSASLSGSQDHEALASRSRETRYHDLLEHRSNFLERRRRIRSQVRALQRLGSRFENLSGHERACIISGQHRTGHCTCRVNNRDAGSTDDGGARASISRIVMLAEALFEVLDEIHQQSVVLSSRPSVSSIGSVPAPTEVVDALPVKVFSKSHKHFVEETSQCYICLVEYEEGDSVRILPCHHEFHGTCVDKWLKEVHRVCPLCRRDICRTDSVSSDN